MLACLNIIIAVSTSLCHVMSDYNVHVHNNYRGCNAVFGAIMSLQYMFTVHVHMHNHTYMPYVWPHGESFCFKLPDSRTGLRVRACVRAYVVVRACVLHVCMCACVRAYVCVDHTVISVHVLSYTS